VIRTPIYKPWESSCGEKSTQTTIHHVNGDLDLTRA
jgi:hypothetical protein